MESGTVDHVPVFLLGVLRVVEVAVGLLHLLVVDVAHLHLRFGRFGRIGEEGDEVLVLGFGLGQRGGAAFLEPAVADGELGAHPVFGVRIGVEHGLQVEPGHVVLALLQGDHRLVEELLVGLLGVDIGQGIA